MLMLMIMIMIMIEVLLAADAEHRSLISAESFPMQMATNRRRLQR